MDDNASAIASALADVAETLEAMRNEQRDLLEKILKLAEKQYDSLLDIQMVALDRIAESIVAAVEQGLSNAPWNGPDLEDYPR